MYGDLNLKIINTIQILAKLVKMKFPLNTFSFCYVHKLYQKAKS